MSWSRRLVFSKKSRSKQLRAVSTTQIGCKCFDFLIASAILKRLLCYIKHLACCCGSDLVARMTSIEDRPERDGQATAGPSGGDAQPTGGFTKRKNRGNLRKRPAEDSQDTVGMCFHSNPGVSLARNITPSSAPPPLVKLCVCPTISVLLPVHITKHSISRDLMMQVMKQGKEFRL
jgi:hypothetical protein